jgi:peptidoglycan/LPS O-acetylase OafA/YrhL
MSTPTIAAALARPRNGFGAIRLALAVAVVVSHAFSVTTGNALDEPLMRATGFTLGEHAVNGFFAVSGFLVTMSLERRGARDYVLARVLRILPGLVAAVLATALLLGPAMTAVPLAEYLADPALWRVIRDTLTTFKSNTALPGVFADNPYRSPLGTVWTLKYEVLCYLGVLAFGLAGGLRRVPALILVAGLILALALTDLLHQAMPKGLETALRLPLIFAAGAALYLWRDTIRLSGLPLAALALAAVLLHGLPLYRPALFLAEAYGAIWLGLSPWLARSAFDPRADLSYGIYLYGWPIQQALHALLPGLAPLALLGPSLLLTGLVAAASWYGVEKPALGLKARVMGRSGMKTATTSP